MIEINGHKNPPPHRRKIIIEQGFKSGNWENQGNSTVNFWLFCFANQLTFFNRKTMSFQQEVYD